MGSFSIQLISTLAVGPLLASCVSGPAASHNLDSLLDSNNELRHVVPLRSFTDELTGQFGVSTSVTSDVVVGDPGLEALHQMLDLISAPTDSLAGELRVIRQLSRYAVQCPGQLARERAILGLGPWLVKLKVKGPMDPPRVPSEAEDLSALIGQFYSDWKAAPDKGTDDLQASADVLLDTEIDTQGMWRVLKGLEALASQNRATPAMEPILIQLARSLEARSLAMALGSGLRDRNPIVRAAAMETGMGHLDYSFIIEALDCLNPAEVDDQGRVLRTRLHALYPIVPGEGLVVQRVLDQLAVGGLGLPEDLDPAVRNNTRQRVLRLVIRISYDVVTYDEASRAAALRALVALAPEGPGSRRKEDWEGWWRDLNQQAQEKANAEAAEDAPTDA